MKRFPWKGAFIDCMVIVALVAARCAATYGMTTYYGGNGLLEILADTWTYVGLAAALVGIIALICWRSSKK